MAIVNVTSGNLAFSTTNNITIPAVASGNSLLIAVTSNTDREPTSVTDNGGGSPTYTFDTAAGGQQLEAAANRHAFLIRRNNITTAPTQVSITFELAPLGKYLILELDNLASASYVESGLSTRTFVTSSSAASITTAAANRIGIAFSNSAATRVHTGPGGDWTDGPTSDSAQDRIYYSADLGAAGSESFSFSIDSTAQWLVCAVYAYASEASSTNASGSASGVGSTTGVGTVVAAADRFPIPPFVSISVSG